MIDMHSHVLYGVDDGAQTIADSVEMIEAARDAGFDEIVLTPHYMPYGRWHTGLDEIEKRFEILKRVVEKLEIPVTLHLGTEIDYKHAVPDQICDGLYTSYAGTCYFLLETDRNGASSEAMIAGVKRLGEMGFSSILAHPERYDFVQEDVSVLEDFISEGCLIQGNYLSLTGYYRPPAKETLVEMLRRGYVHTLGSDAHQREGYDLYPRAAAIGLQTVGKNEWEKITIENPHRIIHEKKLIIPGRTGVHVTSSASLGDVDLDTVL